MITAIGGMGGIGKTALAVAWARDLADRFPDGQLYVNLRGFDAGGRVMTPDDALNHLLGSIGAERSPAVESLEARSARFRSMMAGRASWSCWTTRGTPSRCGRSFRATRDVS